MAADLPDVRRVHVLGAATSAGAHGPGQELAPAAFRRHGLLERLEDAGVEVVDHGDVVRLPVRDAGAPPEPGRVPLRDARRVAAAAQVVAAHVEDVLAAAGPADRLLVLGGDCTVQLGVVAGARAAAPRPVGLAYLDLDCDLTSPAHGNGVADWTGVTHLLDAPDADQRLAHLDEDPPLLTPDTLRLVAADLATPYEQERLTSLGLTRSTSAQVREHGEEVVAQLLAWADDLGLLSVHLDVDVLDQRAFPVAEEVRDTPGLHLDDVDRVVGALMAHPAARVLTVCEVNPERPPDPDAAFARLVGVLVRALTSGAASRSASR